MNEHIPSGKIRASECLLGLRPGESGGFAHSQFSAMATKWWRNGSRKPKYEAFPGVLNGGIIGTLLDCHCNWTAAWHLMKQAGEDHPPCTVTADYAIKLLRPTPTNGPVFLSAKVVESTADRATIEGTLSGRRKSLCDLPRDIRRGEGRPSRLPSLVKQQRLSLCEGIC